MVAEVAMNIIIKSIKADVDQLRLEQASICYSHGGCCSLCLPIKCRPSILQLQSPRA